MKELDIDMLRSRKGDAVSSSDEQALLDTDDDDYEMVAAPLINKSPGLRLQLRNFFSGSRRLEHDVCCLSPLLRALRWFHRQWSLMSSHWRTVTAALFIFSAIYLLLEVIDLCYQYPGLGNHNIISKTLSGDLSFSVVINTYKRPKVLQEAIQHYAVTCGRSVGIQTVFVIWSELDQTPPDPASLLQNQQNIRRSSHNYPSEVVILRMSKNSLNTRFLPIAQLKSDAVFMVDDDVRVACRSLRHGFQAWLTAPDIMVGYYPRLAISKATSATITTPARTTTTTKMDQDPKHEEFVYHSWPAVFLRQKFNFVLTKASFFHRKYMELYSGDGHPQEIRDYVDRFKNCEDVAMSLLVANVTAAKPIYIEGSIGDKGLFGGISTGSGHMARRSQCLTDLTFVYQQHGWGSPLRDATSLRDNSWIHHAFAWQYKPANIFEWFALGNFFK